jgi:hypothetical protein
MGFAGTESHQSQAGAESADAAVNHRVPRTYSATLSVRQRTLSCLLRYSDDRLKIPGPPPGTRDASQRELKERRL